MTCLVVTSDNRDALARMPEACVDSVVCDPPYGLSREPDVAEVLRHWLAGDDYQHTGGGFMGKSWDSFVPGPSVWREVRRVLKPGGHVLAFFGTRTYDLGTLAMRLAGFEIRDQLAWMYGSGFPKSLDVSKAIDKAAGAQREVIGNVDRPAFTKGRGHGRNEDGTPIYLGVNGGHGGQITLEVTAPATEDAKRWNGWGTALKPAHEPIVLARKPLIGTVAANVLAHGTGGLNIDGTRIETTDNLNGGAYSEGREPRAMAPGGAPRNAQPGEYVQPTGRWPANVLLDEAAAAMLDEQSGDLKSGGGDRRSAKNHGIYNERAAGDTPRIFDANSGGASRFFYVAKASKAEREAGLDHLPVRTGGELTDRVDGSDGLNSPRAGAGRKGGRRNNHPTVKPIALMRYLCRLITPPSGIVLDPFAGSGSTLVAAQLEGFHAVGIELDPAYADIARARAAHWRNEA